MHGITLNLEKADPMWFGKPSGLQLIPTLKQTDGSLESIPDAISNIIAEYQNSTNGTKAHECMLTVDVYDVKSPFIAMHGTYKRGSWLNMLMFYDVVTFGRTHVPWKTYTEVGFSIACPNELLADTIKHANRVVFPITNIVDYLDQRAREGRPIEVFDFYYELYFDPQEIRFA